MAVPPLELRPRGALALMDAAVRLSARSSALWALTLPGAALMTAALLYLVARHAAGAALWPPSLLLALAWMGRAVFQGAACRHLEAELLELQAPSMSGALRAALGKLPALWIAASLALLVNVWGTLFTLGLAYLFTAPLVTSYAVAMQGRGHPLALLLTAGRLLGPARSSTLGVRLLLAFQLPLLIALHAGAAFALVLGRSLLGLDLAFAVRYASLDNPAWMALLFAVGFTLMEPLRAAAATLLVVDGRVRQEGLDLVASLDQLPRRTRPGPARAGVGAAALALVALWGPGEALGAESDLRLEKLLGHCGAPEAAPSDLSERLSPAEKVAWARLVSELERLGYDEGDCPGVRARAGEALPLALESTHPQPAHPRDAAEQARALLARPEFAAPPPTAGARSPDEPSAWERFSRWVAGWLDRLFDPARTSRAERPAAAFGEQVAALLAVLALGAAALALGWGLWMLLRSRRPRRAGEHRVERLSPEVPLSALARPPAGWAELADDLARQGRFGEAVRALYLALLASLHRAGAISYDPTLSNREYLQGFRGPDAALRPFRQLTDRFDRAIYGRLPVGPDAYRAFRGLAEPLLHLPPAPEPS